VTKALAVAQVRFGDVARSAGGAALHDHLPGRFTLYPRKSPTRECKMIWKRGCSIGVSFVARPVDDASMEGS
jgi:hypothetical protein